MVYVLAYFGQLSVKDDKMISSDSYVGRAYVQSFGVIEAAQLLVLVLVLFCAIKVFLRRRRGLHEHAKWTIRTLGLGALGFLLGLLGAIQSAYVFSFEITEYCQVTTDWYIRMFYHQVPGVLFPIYLGVSIAALALVLALVGSICVRRKSPASKSEFSKLK